MVGCFLMITYSGDDGIGWIRACKAHGSKLLTSRSRNGHDTKACDIYIEPAANVQCLDYGARECTIVGIHVSLRFVARLSVQDPSVS